MVAATDGHMHEATIRFIDADHIETEWTYYEGGKADHAATFELARVTD